MAAVKGALPERLADRAMETPSGDLSWPWSEITEVLDAAASKDIAILGGEMYGTNAGAFVEVLPGTDRFTLWNTEPRTADEAWSAYCRRTADESRLAVTSLDEALTLKKEGPDWCLRLAPSFAVRNDLRLMVPRDKHDHVRAELAIAAGYPTVEPILPELLEWLQDMNWPVARTLQPFLVRIGLPLAPHIRSIFGTDDEIWKYWVINELVSNSRELAWELRKELRRIAMSPTATETEEELDGAAASVLKEHRIHE